MEKVTISTLKNNLSAYLRKVRSGATVVIFDRDVPVARIERIEATSLDSDRLQLLSAQGVTRLPQQPFTVQSVRGLLGKPLPGSARLLDALQADRAEDR